MPLSTKPTGSLGGDSMTKGVLLHPAGAMQLRRVLILADSSARWKIAGLRQLDRLLLSLHEFAGATQPNVPVKVCVFWDPAIASCERWVPDTSKLDGLEVIESADEFLAREAPDLALNTRLVLYRESLPSLLAASEQPAEAIEARAADWHDLLRESQGGLPASQGNDEVVCWEHLETRADIAACERRLLKNSGKSQDGLAARFVNRPLSRFISRWLLRTSLTPSTWSMGIFILPLCASVAFVQGTYAGFVAGCAIFQLYSILDGCDGEIARAKFLQSEFGRRLDSLCDLIGNALLALTLGVGLARRAEPEGAAVWFYLLEGVSAAILIVLSEGIVFIRRSRSGNLAATATRWNGALYHRHHEFLERSGILFFGERFAWWLVQLTKRDMAMLAFLILALVGWPEFILHLLFVVSGITSALAGKAFLRQPASVLPQEAR